MRTRRPGSLDIAPIFWALATAAALVTAAAATLNFAGGF